MSDLLVDIQKLDKKYVLTSGMLNSTKRVVHAVDDVNLQIINEINRCTIECTIDNIVLKCYNIQEY